MTPTLNLRPELANLPQVREHLAALAATLGLEADLERQVCSAGVRAFSALCLAQGRDRPARLSLDRSTGPLRLKLSFSPPGLGWPPGLSPALFSPPARRVNYRQQGELGVWTAFWEDGP